MNTKKSIKIDQLTEGYNVTNLETNDVFAISQKMLITKIKSLFGITDIKSNTKISQVKTIPVTPVSIPAPISESALPLEPKPSAQQKLKKLAQIKDPNGLLIPKFKYDPAQEKKIDQYTNMFVVELPDGRAMIRYNEAHYYTTQEKVMQIPYLANKKYFHDKGISTTTQICLRAYRQHLHFASITKDQDKPESKPEQVGSEDGTCDDVMFESCANNSPEKCKFCVDESRYENKNKLAAQKPSPPLLKATILP